MTFEEILDRDGSLVYRTKGVSMKPMLYPNRDLVYIRAFEGRLKKYDVALYKRDNLYVLHRVVNVMNGYYLIRGDNTYKLEYVPEEAVIGKLDSFVREGKQHLVTDWDYCIYARLWNVLYPLRCFAKRCITYLRH